MEFLIRNLVYLFSVIGLVGFSICSILFFVVGIKYFISEIRGGK